MKEEYNILFIDDRDVDNFIVQMEIEHEEIPITGRYEMSGEEALDFLATLKREEFPDVIMVDLNMPMMNGFEFVEEYTKLYNGSINDLPLIYILSSSIRTSDRERALNDVKISNFFSKPFNKQMFEKVKQDYAAVIAKQEKV